MNPKALSADAQAIVLACAHLSSAQRPADPAPPLSPAEWSDVAGRLPDSPFGTPAGLLGQRAAALVEALGISADAAERLQRRLERGAQLAVEVERLSALGIWVLTQADAAYPARWRERLGRKAPPVVFGAGDRALLGEPGLAIVGSRHVENGVLDFARAVARRCVASGLVVVSGAAKGIDQAAIQEALESEGRAAGVLADSLERTIRSADVRRPIVERRLVLVSPYHPRAPFTVPSAMGRNKLIYALAEWGLVVETSHGAGGTWAGAQEVLKHRWVPLFVRAGDSASPGNRALLQQGALYFPRAVDEVPLDLAGWLEGAASSWMAADRPVATQPNELPAPAPTAPGAAAAGGRAAAAAGFVQAPLALEPGAARAAAPAAACARRPRGGPRRPERPEAVA